MSIQLKSITKEDAQPWLRRYVETLTIPFESFFEDHVLASNFYEIRWNGEPAGLTAVHANNLLTLFHLAPQYSWLGQHAFAAARKMESVQTALVPSFDDLFLSVALESAREVKPQAYVFQRLSEEAMLVPEAFVLRPAGPTDHDFIQQSSGDFYDPIPDHIERGQLFIGHFADQPVAIGIIERSQLQPGIASVGMFVLPDHRQRGHGTSTILALQAHCLQNNLTPIAGCWYYNHNSKKTLEKAGLFSRSRLFRVTL